MKSKKLDTEQLAQQIEHILDEDGLSPEKLANASGIAKSTIYAILNRERPTSQRQVAQKISKATHRRFRIDDDKIFFDRPAPIAVRRNLSSVDNKILERIGHLLRDYSAEEKTILLEHGLDSAFGKTIDLVLSISSHERQSSTDSRHAWDTGTRDITQRFCEIWDSLGASKEEKIQATNDLLKHTNLPKMIYTSFRLDINILNPNGDAHIIWKYHGTNVGDEDIVGESKSIWFEKKQVEDIRLTGTSDRPVPLKIDTLRDYENYKEFFCNFEVPVSFGESIKYSYEYHPQEMFRTSHYWDWQVRNLVLNTRITIRHNSGKKLKSYEIKKETPKGLITEPNTDFTVRTDESQAEIVWAKYFPEYGAKYRIHWEFYD
jgi:transcriptional regulator with XRE-family HTH domain